MNPPTPSEQPAGDGPLEWVRALALALPGVTEKVSHGGLGFFAGRQFALLWADGHHDHRFPHLWCAAPPGMQQALIADAVDGAVFRPPYVGHRGWIGVRLDRSPDREGIADLLEDAYRVIAPARLLAELDATEPRPD